ncbi:hypothetical protein D3C85_1207770 [compost metagenome]
MARLSAGLPTDEVPTHDGRRRFACPLDFPQDQRHRIAQVRCRWLRQSVRHAEPSKLPPERSQLCAGRSELVQLFRRQRPRAPNMVVDQHDQVAAGLHLTGTGPLCCQRSIAVAKPQRDAIRCSAIGRRITRPRAVGLQHFVEHFGEQSRFAEFMVRSQCGKSRPRIGRHPGPNHARQRGLVHRNAMAVNNV